MRDISQDDANYGSFLFSTSWIKLALVGLLSGFGGQNGFHMLMGLLKTTGQFIFPSWNVAAPAFLAFTGFTGNAARHCCLKSVRNDFT